jgi:site-specific recombinase XerD
VRYKTVKSYQRGIFVPLHYFGEGDLQQVLSRLAGEHHIITHLLTGSGLRVAEVVRLQVQSIDFEQSQMLVRGGKQAQDRITMLPEIIVARLKQHPATVIDLLQA